MAMTSRHTACAALAACVFIFLAACGQRDASQPDPAAAARVGPASPLPTVLPPASQSPRYVGLWAHTQQGCSNPVWTIRANSVQAPGGSCTFNSVSPIQAGYDVRATCTGDGASRQYRMQFAFAESAHAMLIEGGPWDSSTALVFCGAVAP